MNSLGIDLHGKVVMLKADGFPSSYTEENRKFMCSKGWGCAPDRGSDRIYGWFLDDEMATLTRIRSYEIEKLV